MNREYNSGSWTVSRYQSFIKSLLRAGSRRWPPKYEVLNEAKVGKQVNSKTGRIAEHYKCTGCGNCFPAKEVQVDHINCVTDLAGFISWDDTIDNMFCEKGNLQVLCLTCHKTKTSGEKEIRASYNKLRKEFPREFNTWYSMNRRCDEESFYAYKWYGGRGIKVSGRWARGLGAVGFSNFLEDMGSRPDGMTLDRIEVDKDYAPDNCRWADELTQKRNTSRTVYLDLEGELVALQDAAEIYGISPKMVYKRLRKGCTPRQALGLDPTNLKGDWLSWLDTQDIEEINELINSGLRGDALLSSTGLTKNQMKVYKRKKLHHS